MMCPTNIIADCSNNLDENEPSPLHYISEYYDYAWKCVKNIIEDNPHHLEKNNLLFMQTTELFDRIRIQDYLSKFNTLKHIDDLYKETAGINNVDDVMDYIDAVISRMKDEEFIPELYLRKGRIYRDRKDGKADDNLAAEWMRKASEYNLSSAKNELFDILWKINTPESASEMMALAYEFSEEGDAQMTGRIGRAFQEGRGVEKDLDKAAEWMRKSINMGCPWAKWEYFEILWMKDTPESLKTMIEYGKSESDKGNMQLRARMGRAYRDGKGVPKDLRKAADLMKTTHKGDPQWSKWEYVDILWTMRTPETDKEMFDFALPLAKKGRKDLQGRVARMYRDGRGVPKDLDAAIEWMKKAADQNLAWAKWEYFDLLWRKNTPESLKTMIEYGQSESDKGNMQLRARMGRAYRDGKGVPKDLRKAADLMKETHKGKPNWSKWEYVDILWEMDTPETDKEMFDFALPFAEKGQRDLQGRVARMYRDGRGVPKDLDAAIEWMKKAADQNLAWAKCEYFEILWMKNTPESLKTMIEYAQSETDNGNLELRERLGKAYRDGMGVPKNLEKATDLMDGAHKEGS